MGKTEDLSNRGEHVGGRVRPAGAGRQPTRSWKAPCGFGCGKGADGAWKKRSSGYYATLPARERKEDAQWAELGGRSLGDVWK